MLERAEAYPACSRVASIRLGHACGRERWRYKDYGWQFTRTTPCSKPAAAKQQTAVLYGANLSMNAVPS
jgi:hypothetical protein